MQILSRSISALNDNNNNNNNNNNRSFNLVKTHAQPYKHIIHVYVYNEQPVSQDSNIAAHTLPRRTATTQMYANRRNLRILKEIGVEEHDGDVRF